MIISKNGIALLIFTLSYFGIDVAENDVIVFFSAVGQVVSFALLVWNQIKRDDVKGFLFKRW